MNIRKGLKNRPNEHKTLEDNSNIKCAGIFKFPKAFKILNATYACVHVTRVYTHIHICTCTCTHTHA